MGKIKTKLIKKTSVVLNKKDIPFSESFDYNKKILGNTMPSKKIRNQIAGFLARIKRRESKEKAMLKTE
ncbi:MAG TPA: 30S ribosomal protein S17e [Candidatus Omnitrophota bacterium]|nr:30S ribosomal protein S17e [Candidatus Omnitrophota bacterium]